MKFIGFCRLPWICAIKASTFVIEAFHVYHWTTGLEVSWTLQKNCMCYVFSIRGINNSYIHWTSNPCIHVYIHVVEYEKRDHFAQNVFLLPFFKLSPFRGLKSPRLPTWFMSSLSLLLHRFNIRSYSKPPVPSGEPPKSGIKRRFLNEIDVAARPAHTGCGWARDLQRV